MGRQEKIGSLCVIIAGICWGLIGLFTRRLSSVGLDSIQITFLRSLFATILLLIYLFITDKSKLKIKLKDIWIFIGTGICSVSFFNICYFKAIQMTSLSVAAVLLYTAPAMVMIMSCIFFGEKLTVHKVLALVFAFAGCLFTTGLIGSNANISGMGVLIGLGSGFGYALYSIFGTVAVKKYNSFTVTFYTFLLSTIGLFPVSRPLDEVDTLKEHPKAIIVAFSLALIASVLPYIFYTYGLKYVEAGKASIMAYIEPMVATICGIVVFKETLNISIILGIVLIFVSVILLNIKAKSSK